MADRDLQAYYARDKERDRLSTGVGRVEFLRTVEVISRTLPAAPAVVADIGGGPGRYTDWLVDAGYTVVHRDVVASHVEEVRSRHAQRVDSAVGDARALELPDDSVDAVLLLGPLYHLDDLVDRMKALSEARRVVRSHGVVYVAAISRWSARLHGVLVERIHLAYPTIAEIVDEMEATGVIRPKKDGGFTGYAHTPEELRSEIGQAGLHLESLVALEGISFALSDLDRRLDAATERELLMDTLRALEPATELLGLGPHLLATTRGSK